MEFLWTGLLPILGAFLVIGIIVLSLLRLFDKMAEPIHHVNRELDELNKRLDESNKNFAELVRESKENEKNK